MAQIRKTLAYCSIATVLGLVTTVYPNDLKTSEEGLARIAAYENCVSCTYRDHIGIPTIGIGSTRLQDGTRPVDGLRLSDEQVAYLFASDIYAAEQCVITRLNGGRMPQAVFDTAVSLVYNVGCYGVTWNSKFNRKTSIRLAAEAGNWKQVCYYVGDFVYSGGKKSQGLVNRRTDEQAYCVRNM